MAFGVRTVSDGCIEDGFARGQRSTMHQNRQSTYLHAFGHARIRLLSPWIVAFLFGVTLAAPHGAAGQTFELSGSVELELRAFANDPLHPEQARHGGSLAIAPELYVSSSDEQHSFILSPFLRIDSADSERTHADLREAIYQFVGDRWEIRAGFGRVFWGVAESRHLVDLINQTDGVENLDGEDKLGQPMVNISVSRDWGTLDAFLLPYFRERTFPGRHGRLRSQPRVDTDRAQYESGSKRQRLDWAVRYSHSFGDFDVGLSHFHGTSRDPRLLPAVLGTGELVLVPRYDVIHQTGLDLQATKGNWLWKLEAIHRSGQGSTFNAAVAGFEYTFFGIGESVVDLGVLAEFLYDDRGNSAPHPFERDVFLGARLAFNDEASTEVLAGVIRDLGGSAIAFSAEASRRLADQWKLSMELRAWGSVSHTDIQHALRRDDHVQATLQYFF